MLALEDSVLLEVVRPATVCKAWESNPQALANTTWAFATLALKASELLEAVRPKTVCKIWKFNPRALANTAWAFGTRVLKNPALLEAVRPAAVCMIRTFSPQVLANPPGPSRRCMCRTLSCWRRYALRWCVRSGSSVRSTWRIGLGLRDGDFGGLGAAGGFAACGGVCKVWEFNAQDLSNTAWAFATLAVKDSEPMEAVRPRTMCKIWEFNPQVVANTAWAFATFAVKDYELLEAV